MLEPELTRAIERDHEALDALIGGNAKPKKRMFSQRDDVTLANEVQPPIRGLHEIEQALDAVASAFRDGEPHRYERITEYATTDLAYVHEIERGETEYAGSDDLASFSLRRTTIWRREDGEWKIALRHADPNNDTPHARGITRGVDHRAGRERLGQSLSPLLGGNSYTGAADRRGRIYLA